MAERSPNNGRQQKRRQTPESRFYDRLKGEQVCITLSRDGSELTATLLWVDRYSLGIRIGDSERLLNKRSIETIEKEHLGKRKHGDYTSGAPVQ